MFQMIHIAYVFAVLAAYGHANAYVRINEINPTTNAATDRREFVELEYVDYCRLSRINRQVIYLQMWICPILSRG